MTLDLFADTEDEDSLAPLDREERLRDDRRYGGDAVISLSTFGLAFGGTSRVTSERRVSESRVLKGGNFDKLSTSSEESSVWLSGGRI